MDGAVDRVDPSFDARSRDAAMEDRATQSDVVIDPGRCGTRVRECLCACGASAACQQACVNEDLDCSDCLYESLTLCCPMESRVFDECVIMSMCEDDPCILERCAGQWSALQSCARRREREPECLGFVQRCLGPDYPSIQCVRDP